MRLALDTNAYVDLCRGVADTVALLEQAETVMLPFVVVASCVPDSRMVAVRSRTKAFCAGSC